MWVPQEFNWFFKQSCWIGFFKKLSKCNNKEEITLLSELTLFSKTGAALLIKAEKSVTTGTPYFFGLFILVCLQFLMWNTNGVYRYTSAYFK